MKKFFAILLAAIMMLSMTAMASEVTGSITINNATIDETYTAYQIFDVTLNDGTPSYTIEKSDEWYAAVAAATDIFALTTNNDTLYYVTKKDDSVSAAAIADWFKANKDGKTADKTTVATSSTVSWTGLELGYYIVSSSLDVALTIDTTNPDVTIQDKNQGGPSSENLKAVKDADGKDLVSVSIGDTAYFTINFTATNYDGAIKQTQYVVTDTMGKGFTLNDDLTVKVQGQDQEVAVTLTKGTDYTVETSTNEAGATVTTITIKWVDADNNHKFNAVADVTITYSAVINENASTTDATTLTNTAGVGDVGDSTTNTTFKFDLVKTDSEKKLLEGAEFELYDANNTKINLVAETDGYRVAIPGVDTTTTTVIVVDDGMVTIRGLAAGNYKLKETKAPAGYNLVADEQPVGLTADMNATLSEDTTTYVEGGIQVVNLSGQELPSTGGMGTTIFYVVGGMMMAAALVLLVSKRKVAASK